MVAHNFDERALELVAARLNPILAGWRGRPGLLKHEKGVPHCRWAQIAQAKLLK